MIRYSSSALALACALSTAAVHAQEASPAAPPALAPATAPADTADGDAQRTDIVVTAKQTRSATAIPQAETQKILPGVSPLKAIETLPGVLCISADLWGNNEQNAQIFIHGFNF